ncbi:MAG: LEA type 2 family protein [Candidatus Alcyoniella australis]|nr:LEA type 2 family protein [Candidatus Alcyoniella australis]
MCEIDADSFSEVLMSGPIDRLPTIALICMATVALVTLGGCAFRSPSADVQDVELDSVGFERIDTTFVVQVNNPNSYGLRADGLDYELSVNGRGLADGELRQRIEVAARDRVELRLPVTFDVPAALAIIENDTDRDELPYVLTGGITFSTPLGDLRVPFKREGELPLIRPPQVRLEDVRVRKLDLSGARLELRLRIDNPNNFDLKIQRLSWKVGLEGSRLFSGRRLKGRIIPAKGRAVVELELKVGLDELGRALERTLQRGDVRYDLDLDFRLETPYGELPLHLDRKGKSGVSR